VSRAPDLVVVLRGRPVACSITVRVCGTWTLVRLAVATDADLWALAEKLRLEPARTVQRGHAWWRHAALTRSGVLVVMAGRHR
jgi:hypothetical protein